MSVMQIGTQTAYNLFKTIQYFNFDARPDHQTERLKSIYSKLADFGHKQNTLMGAGLFFEALPWLNKIAWDVNYQGRHHYAIDPDEWLECDKHEPMNIGQCLKSLEFVQYQCLEAGDLSDHISYRMLELLAALIDWAKAVIIDEHPQYQAAQWG